MNAQTLLAVRAVIIFVMGIAASRGLVSQETVTWLGSNETMAALGVIAAGVTAGVGIWANRPKAVVAKAGKILEGQGAVIAPPAMANSSISGDNVVTTTAQAAQLPGVR